MQLYCNMDNSFLCDPPRFHLQFPVILKCGGFHYYMGSFRCPHGAYNPVCIYSWHIDDREHVPPQEARAFLRSITPKCQFAALTMFPSSNSQSLVIVGNMRSTAYTSVSDWQFMCERWILRAINVSLTSTSQARRSSLVRPMMLWSEAVCKMVLEEVLNVIKIQKMGRKRTPYKTHMQPWG